MIKKFLTIALVLSLAPISGCKNDPDQKPSSDAKTDETPKNTKPADSKIKAGDECDSTKDADFCQDGNIFTCKKKLNAPSTWAVTDCSKVAEGATCTILPEYGEKAITCALPCDKEGDIVDLCYNKEDVDMNYDIYWPMKCIKTEGGKLYYAQDKFTYCKHGCDKQKNTCLLLAPEEGQLCSPFSYKPHCANDTTPLTCYEPGEKDSDGFGGRIIATTCTGNQVCREFTVNGRDMAECTNPIDSCDAASEEKACATVNGIPVLRQTTCVETSKNDFVMATGDTYCSSCNADTLECTINEADKGAGLQENATCTPQLFVMRCDGNNMIYCSSQSKKVIKEPCPNGLTCGVTIFSQLDNYGEGAYADCFDNTTCTQDKKQCITIDDTALASSMLYSCLETNLGDNKSFFGPVSYEVCRLGCDEETGLCR